MECPIFRKILHSTAINLHLREFLRFYVYNEKGPQGRAGETQNKLNITTKQCKVGNERLWFFSTFGLETAIPLRAHSKFSPNWAEKLLKTVLVCSFGNSYIETNMGLFWVIEIGHPQKSCWKWSWLKFYCWYLC